MRFGFGEYHLDTDARSLLRRGQRVPLEPKAFDVLAYLIEQRHRVVSSGELLDALWPGVNVTQAALARSVQKARRALGDDGEHQKLLRTEHGHGFRFVADVDVLPEPEATLPPTRCGRGEHGSESITAWPPALERRHAPAMSHTAPAQIRIPLRVARAAVLLLLTAAAVWGVKFCSARPTPLRSLAVLPFINLSDNADQEYLAEGVAEELINICTRFEGLRVVGRTSSFSFKGSDADLKTIGEALGVEAILEGSVHTSGNQVHVLAQLVSAKDGFQLWAETYHRELQDIFEIQDDIARQITNALRLELQVSALDWGGTTNIEAYEAFLRGRAAHQNVGAQSGMVALSWYSRAAALDPDFAAAQRALVNIYANLYEFGSISREVAERSASSAMERALALDPESPQTYTTLGRLRQLLGDPAGAEAAYLRAFELSPDAGPHELYGFLLLETLGRPEEGLRHLEKALARDPLNVVTQYLFGYALAASGRVEDGIERLRANIAKSPDVTANYWALAIVQGWSLGRIDESIRWFARALALDPAPWMLAELVHLYLHLDDTAAAARWLEVLLATAPDTYFALTGRYFFALHAGDRQQALEIARAFATRTDRISGYQAVPHLLWLRQLQSVDPEAALAVYERIYPELLSTPPLVQGSNYTAAASLALLRLQTGDRNAAVKLLGATLSSIEKLPVTGISGHGFADVLAHSIAGEPGRALAALQRDVAAGARVAWWILPLDPAFELLWDLPEFQQVLVQIRTEMASQHKHLHEIDEEEGPGFPARVLASHGFR